MNDRPIGRLERDLQYRADKEGGLHEGVNTAEHVIIGLGLRAPAERDRVLTVLCQSLGHMKLREDDNDDMDR